MMIRTWEHFWTEKNNVRYEFSSTHVNLPHGIASQVIQWGKKHIAPEDIYNYDGKFGREDDIHVTVLYGLHDATSENAEEVLQDERPVELELGKVTAFTNNPKFDVIKIDIISPDLHRINKKLKSNLEYTTDYPQYHPHATIAYVKKGKGEKYETGDAFACERITCREIVFSSKTGKKDKIELNGLKKLQIS